MIKQAKAFLEIKDKSVVSLHSYIQAVRRGGSQEDGGVGEVSESDDME